MSVYDKATMMIRKGPDEDERIVTFNDGIEIVVSEAWYRLGGFGWSVPGIINHTCKSIKQAAIDARKARERKVLR